MSARYTATRDTSKECGEARDDRTNLCYYVTMIISDFFLYSYKSINYGGGRIIVASEIWLEIFTGLEKSGRWWRASNRVSPDRIDSSNRAAVTLFPLEQTLFSARRSLNRVIIGEQRFSTLLNPRNFVLEDERGAYARGEHIRNNF